MTTSTSKVIAVCVATVLLAAILSACGGGPPENGPARNANGESACGP